MSDLIIMLIAVVAAFILTAILIDTLDDRAKKRHQALLEYLYQLQFDSVPPSKNQREPEAKVKKGSAYIPSRDVEKQLSGEVGDDWD